MGLPSLPRVLTMALKFPVCMHTLSHTLSLWHQISPLHLQYFSIVPVVRHDDWLIIALAVDVGLLTLFSWQPLPHILQRKPTHLCIIHTRQLYYCSVCVCIERVRPVHHLDLLVRNAVCGGPVIIRFVCLPSFSRLCKPTTHHSHKDIQSTILILYRTR